MAAADVRVRRGAVRRGSARVSARPCSTISSRSRGSSPATRLLEVGCATGRRPGRWLERGFSVTCVELGPQLAGRPPEPRRFRGRAVEVRRSRRGTAGPAARPGLRGDGVALDRSDGPLQRRRTGCCVRAAISPSGRAHVFPEGGDPFFSEIQDVYDEIGERHDALAAAAARDSPDDAHEIDATGCSRTAVRQYAGRRQYTADEYIALLETFSGHIAMEPVKRERLYAEIRHASPRARTHVCCGTGAPSSTSRRAGPKSGTRTRKVRCARARTPVHHGCGELACGLTEPGSRAHRAASSLPCVQRSGREVACGSRSLRCLSCREIDAPLDATLFSAGPTKAA